MSQKKFRSKRNSIRRKKSRYKKEIRQFFDYLAKQQQKRNKKKGDLSEQKADLALDNLEKKLNGLIYFQHNATKKNGIKDRYFAIDHIIIFEYPEHDRVEFQIKSSEAGAKKHKQLHPNIPVVVIPISQQEIQERVFFIEEAEKEILDKLFKEYFIRNYSKISYNNFLKENYQF